MMRRCRVLRTSLLRATRRRRGRQVPVAPPLPAPSAASSRELPERPWSLDELGAAALELGLYPELEFATEPA